MYLEAGTSAGLSPGMILPVVTENEDTVGQVQVLSVTSTSSLCKILQESEQVLPGHYVLVATPESGPPPGGWSRPVPIPEGHRGGRPRWSASLSGGIHYQRLSDQYRAAMQTLRLSVHYGSSHPEQPIQFRFLGHIRGIQRGALPDIPARSKRMTLYAGNLTLKRSAFRFLVGRFYPTSLPAAGLTDGIQLGAQTPFPVSVGILVGYAARPDSINFTAFRWGAFGESQLQTVQIQAGFVSDQNHGRVVRQRFLGNLRGQVSQWRFWSGFQINRYPKDIFGDMQIPEIALTRWLLLARGPLLHEWTLSLHIRWNRVEYTPTLLQQGVLPSFQLRRVYGLEIRHAIGSMGIDWISEPTRQLRIQGTAFLRAGFLRWTPHLEWVLQDLYTVFNAEIHASTTVGRLSLDGGVRSESAWSRDNSATDFAVFMKAYRPLAHRSYFFASIWHWFGRYRQGISLQVETGVRME